MSPAVSAASSYVESLLRRLDRLFTVGPFGRRYGGLDLSSQPVGRGQLAGGFGRIPAMHRERRQLVAYARLSPPVAELVVFGEARQLHSEGAFGFAAESGHHAKLVERPGDAPRTTDPRRGRGTG